MRTLGATLVSAICVLACRSNEQPASSRELPSVADAAVSGALPDSSQQLARATYWHFVDTLDVSRTDVIARFGSPLTITVDTARNQWDSLAIDSVVRIEYGDWRFVFYLPQPKGFEELLSHVDLRQRRPDLPFSLGPGVPSPALLERFGAPSFRFNRGDSLVLGFVTGEMSENSLQFTILADTVRTVSWVFYID